MTRGAVFLDRDGTINVEKNYVHRLDQWEWIAGAPEAIGQINRLGLAAIVVTNQSGIARGYYTPAEVIALHEAVDAMLAAHGARIDGYYFCPHHPQYGDQIRCDCRKPAPGMLQQAAEQHAIDLRASWLVGDHLTDIEAAQHAGVTPILVRTGHGALAQDGLPPGVLCVADLAAAAQHIAHTHQGARSPLKST